MHVQARRARAKGAAHSSGGQLLLRQARRPSGTEQKGTAALQYYDTIAMPDYNSIARK